MGDVVSLVEKAAETIAQDEAERLANAMKGQFDLEDMLTQLRQLKKWAVSGVMGMLPGIGKLQKQMDAAQVDAALIKRQEAIILSMTRRAACPTAQCRAQTAGGERFRTSVPEVNRVVKQYKEMAGDEKWASAAAWPGCLAAVSAGAACHWPAACRASAAACRV